MTKIGKPKNEFCDRDNLTFLPTFIGSKTKNNRTINLRSKVGVLIITVKLYANHWTNEKIERG